MKKNYPVKIDNIIALCHILDDFEEFKKRLIPIVSSRFNGDFPFQLLDVSEGKLKFGARKVKRFYVENKSVIDIINIYANIADFIYDMCDESEEKFQELYAYISAHRDEINQILDVLGKLKELGFRKFTFDESLDFSKETYEVIAPVYTEYFHFIYVANLNVIPNYTSDIHYGTKSSNYKMELDTIWYDKMARFGEITLNSLLFDPKDLPDKLDREHTLGHLLRLKEEQKEQISIIRNSVDLSISVFDLENELRLTNSVICKLDGVENKEQLLDALNEIKGSVDKLNTLSMQYDTRVTEQDPLITTEILGKEKEQYLKSRRISRIID